MYGPIEQTPHRYVEPLQGLRQTRRTAIFGDLRRRGHDRSCCRKKRDDQEEKQLDSAGCHRFAELYYMPDAARELRRLREFGAKKKPRTTLMPCRNSRLVFPGLILSFSPLTPCENETLTTAIPECRIHLKQSRHHITGIQVQ